MRCWSLRGQVAGWLAARWRPVAATAPASGAADGPVTHANTATQNHPKETNPRPPTTNPHFRQHYNNRLSFIISTTSPCVCRLVSAVSTRFKAEDSYSHVTLSDYLCFQWREGLHSYHNSDATGVPPTRMSDHRATETSN